MSQQVKDLQSYQARLVAASQARPAKAFGVRVAGHVLPHSLTLLPPDPAAFGALAKSAVVQLQEVTVDDVVAKRQLLVDLKELLLSLPPAKHQKDQSYRLTLLGRLATTLYPLLLTTATKVQATALLSVLETKATTKKQRKP